MNQEQADQGIMSFNELQNQLTESLNPESVKQQAKEVIANMLLMMAVPYFAGRLKNALPDDVFNKIKNFLDDGNFNFKDALTFSKQLFEEKILNPLKNELVSELKGYIPELKDIDLTKTSLSDLQNFFTKNIIAKMKSKLPPEIADKLPENFTQEDILNSVKSLTKEQAMNFAKKNLPEDVYKELQQNQDLIDNPSKISDFIKQKISDTQDTITEKISQYKDIAQQRFNEIKQQIQDKIDENIKPFQDKIQQLNQAKEDLMSKWEDGINDIKTKLDDYQTRLADFKEKFPDFTNEQIKPFQDEYLSLKKQAETLDTNYYKQDGDLESQISNAQAKIEDITNQLVQKAQNVQDNVLGKAQEVRAQAEETLNNAKSDAQSFIDKVKSFFTGDEEQPSIFERAKNLMKAPEKDIKITSKQPNVQESILSRDPEEPLYLSQDDAQRIRLAQTQEPQEVLPRLQQRQQQLEQEQEQTQQLREQEKSMTQSQEQAPPTEAQEAPVIKQPTAEQPSTLAESGEEAQATAEATTATTEASTTAGETAGILTGESTLDAVAGATSEIPIVDVITSIGAIIGSIFGAKALMKDKAPPQPEVSGESYEPNL